MKACTAGADASVEALKLLLYDMEATYLSLLSSAR